ncbi:MAG TPA: DUF1080 domain-containing protein [Tepidisphaeraceae bacterium]|nr:DUF1080 domain-containing protein [Tepidisphaeraceae bacterium]
MLNPRPALFALALLPLASPAPGEDQKPAQRVEQPAADRNAKAPEIKTATADDARHFFNGKDLSNWWGDMSLWHVEDGEIVGKTAKGIRQNEFLKSRVSVGDFRLICKIKLVPNEANSGIQFHSVQHEGNEMAGPQADAGKGWWGKLYGENFHDRVLAENKSGEQVVRPNEWNTYEVLAVGTKVRTAMNGQLCVDYEAADLPRTGMFGLQIHAGGPTEVRFKDIKLELNPKWELKTLDK